MGHCRIRHAGEIHEQVRSLRAELWDIAIAGGLPTSSSKQSHATQRVLEHVRYRTAAVHVEFDGLHVVPTFANAMPDSQLCRLVSVLILFLRFANPGDVRVQLPNVLAQFGSVRLMPFKIVRMPFERGVFTL